MCRSSRIQAAGTNVVFYRRRSNMAQEQSDTYGRNTMKGIHASPRLCESCRSTAFDNPDAG
jgi:hypothetical protein